MRPEPALTELASWISPVERATSSAFAARFPRAFVTGAAGFIGSHVVLRLLDAGVEVTCLVAPGDPAPSLAGLPVRRVMGDLTRPETYVHHLAGHPVAFHLAAIYALWLPEPRRMFDVNVGGTRAFLTAAREAGVPRVVYTSSIAAVGIRPGEAVSDETEPFADWDVANDYVVSKYIAELEAFACAAPGFDVVAVNPTFPFGRADRAPTPTGKLVFDVVRGRLPVVVEGGLNVVDVRDVAEGHLLGALHGQSGRRYLLGGDNVTFADLAARVARQAGRNPPRFTAPAAAFIGMGKAAELISTRLLRRPPTYTERGVAYTAGRWLWVDTTRARTELGYAPRPIDAAIARAVDWFSRWRWDGRPPA
jgi:dihydroflavonol-4-reductase